MADATTSPATQPSQSRPAAPEPEAIEGHLEPLDPFEVRIRPKVYGGELTLKAVAPNGASVKAGDVLVEIDPKPLQKQLAAAENELKVAGANADKAEADAKIAEEAEALNLRQQQDALRQAQENARWWETVDGPQMIRGSELQLRQFKARVEDQQDELDQLQKMYKGSELTNATADIVVKRAVRALDISKAEADMASQRDDKLKTFSYPIEKQRVADAVQSATLSLEQLKIAQKQSKVVRDAGLVTTRTALEDAQQKVADLYDDLAHLTAKAPVDGIVAYGPFAQEAFFGDPHALRAGEKVGPQAVLMTLYTPGKLRGVVHVPEAKFVTLNPGDAVRLTVPAYPGLTLHGKFEAGPRTPVGSDNRPPFYSRTIELNDVDPRLAPGSAVSVFVENKPPATTATTASTRP